MTYSRTLISSGSVYEPVIGYSRAVKAGDFVFIAGTTSGAPGGAIGGTDAGEQTREIFRRVKTALDEAGASFADVVRTRIYLPTSTTSMQWARCTVRSLARFARR